MSIENVHYALETNCRQAFMRRIIRKLDRREITLAVNVPYFWFTVLENGKIKRWAIETTSTTFTKRDNERTIIIYQGWFPGNLGLNDMKRIKAVFYRTINGIPYARL